MSTMFETIGEIMFKRNDLKTFQAYHERKSGKYFWTPDCVGVYWFDTKQEVLDELMFTTVISVEELED